MRKFLFLSLIILLSVAGCKNEKLNEKIIEQPTPENNVMEVNIPESEVTIIDSKEESIDEEVIESKKSEEVDKTKVITSNKKSNNKKSETVVENDKQVKSNDVIVENKEEKVEIKEEVKDNKDIKEDNKTEPVKDNKTENSTSGNNVEVNYTDNSNDLMYSITHGIAEYNSESECKKVGYRIKEKELDEILDWNYDHPEAQKQPTIKSSMCIVVIKNNKEYWFLHFITVSGNNMDAELKKIYN